MAQGECKNPICSEVLACKKIMDEFSASEAAKREEREALERAEFDVKEERRKARKNRRQK